MLGTSCTRLVTGDRSRSDHQVFVSQMMNGMQGCTIQLAVSSETVLADFDEVGGCNLPKMVFLCAMKLERVRFYYYRD